MINRYLKIEDYNNKDKQTLFLIEAKIPMPVMPVKKSCPPKVLTSVPVTMKMVRY